LASAEVRACVARCDLAQSQCEQRQRLQENVPDKLRPPEDKSGNHRGRRSRVVGSLFHQGLRFGYLRIDQGKLPSQSCAFPQHNLGLLRISGPFRGERLGFGLLDIPDLKMGDF